MQISDVKNDLMQLGLEDNLNQAMILYLCGTARKMRRKMSVLIEGNSGYGKSYLVTEILKLFPKETRMNISTITQAGLMRLGDVEQMILFVLEKYHDPDVALVLRELMSEGKVARFICNGKRVEELKLFGPPTLFETTITSGRFPPQNRSRSYAIGINVSDEARNNILSIQRQQRTVNGLLMDMTKEQIRIKHQKFQRKLKKHLGVIIPFAERVKIPQFTNLRTQERFLNLIETIAFFQQAERPIHSANGTVYVEAYEADFYLAKELLRNLYVNEYEYELPQDAVVFAKGLLGKRESLMNQADFSRNDLLQQFPEFKSFKPIKSRLDPLIDAGFVNVTKRGGIKNSYAYRLDDRFSDMELDELDGNCYSSFSLS